MSRWLYRADVTQHERCVHGMQGKAGMEFLVRVAAKAYTKRGINFNAIIPGNVLAGVLPLLVSGRSLNSCMPCQYPTYYLSVNLTVDCLSGEDVSSS